MGNIIAAIAVLGILGAVFGLSASRWYASACRALTAAAAASRAVTAWLLRSSRAALRSTAAP